MNGVSVARERRSPLIQPLSERPLAAEVTSFLGSSQTALLSSLVVQGLKCFKPETTPNITVCRLLTHTQPLVPPSSFHETDTSGLGTSSSPNLLPILSVICQSVLFGQHLSQP